MADQDDIDEVTFTLTLPKPLVDLIEARGKRQTPVLRRNQQIEADLSKEYNWTRAAYLAERRHEQNTSSE